MPPISLRSVAITRRHIDSTRWRGETEPDAYNESIMEHLVRRAIVRPDGRAVEYVRSILEAPSEALRVSRIARRTYVSRRTLCRHLRREGVPAAIDWIALARAVRAHKTIVRGGPLRIAAAAAGYPDQFAMSNAIHRITGVRPSQLRDLSSKALIDLWIARQHERGNVTGPPEPAPAACPVCGHRRAS